MQLTNNIILITGGASGIGLALAKELVKDNKVIVCGRDKAKLEKTKQFNIHPIKCDVTNPKECKQLYNIIKKKYGSINILVNNAGVLNKKDFRKRSIEEEIEINLIAPINLTKLFLPLLKKNAAIINVTSLVAITPMPGIEVYSASKAGFAAFTRAIRMTLKNIKVFDVAPPGVDTPMTKGWLEKSKMISPERVAKEIINGMKKDRYHICIGQSKLAYWVNKLSPRLSDVIMQRI